MAPATRLGPETVIGVIGAGAMGGGIAQAAAAAGHRVIVTDAKPEALDRAREGLRQAMERDVAQGRRPADEAAALQHRVTWSHPPPGSAVSAMAAGFRECGLVIEAIVEQLAAKQETLRAVEEAVAPGAVLATNTSSLSVTAIAGACRRPERVVGMHFFNPAPVMPLVEIVPALVTAPEITAAARDLADRWGKTSVVAADTPGFIVNRVARPFYGEALRVYEEGVADRATIDWAMTELGGFRMGPFALMDLIGNDVNYAVTCSVYQALHHDPRYRPSVTQQRMVEAGLLGRKSGRGHYDYAPGAAPPEPDRDAARGRAIVDRILAMLVNEAADARFWRIASARDLDLAVTAGVNYPKGLLAWGDEIGPGVILQRLEALQAEYGEDRYRPSPLLRRVARNGGRLGP
jgi:3-hydroxybutyryl-CoA dehydrogenase